MSMVADSYVPHSYVDYIINGTTILASATAFAFPKEFLLLDHLECWHYDASVNAWANISGDTTFTGTSGAGTATLGGGAPSRADSDIIRVKRVTPDTGAERTVTFQDGSLDAADGNTAQLQVLYIAQEVRDELNLRLGLQTTAEQVFEGGGKIIRRVGAPQLADDVAIYQTVLDVAASSGNVPPVSTANNNNLLAVQSGVWTPTAPGTVKALLLVGTAADRDVGTGSTDIPDIPTADARYLQIANNLSDISADTGRANLGIPESNPAALLQTTDEGVGADRVVELDADSRYPAADGRNIDLSSHTLVGNSGRLGAIGRFALGVYSQTFTTSPATVDVPVSGLTSQLNSGLDIVLDTANNYVTLKTGTYWIDVSLTLTNEDASNDSSLIWKVRSGVTGTPADEHVAGQVTLRAKASSTGHYNTTLTDTVKVVVTGATDVFDIQAYKGTVTTGDPRVVAARVLITEVKN